MWGTFNPQSTTCGLPLDNFMSEAFQRPTEVAVVGAGIAGCTIAWELARRGVRVTLLERDAIAFHASGRNMGLLLNQTEPGVVQIMQRSIAIYRELEGGPVQFALRSQRQMLVAANEAQLLVTRGRADELRRIGVLAHEVLIAELLRDCPQLNPELAGAYVVENAWALDPWAATAAFAEAAREAGADVRTGVRASQVKIESGQVVGLVTDDGILAADAVVLASGPWLAELWRHAPVGSGRGWVLRTGRLPFPLPWILEEMTWPDQDELGRGARSPRLSEVAAGYDRPVAEAMALAPMPEGDALLGTSLSPSLRDTFEGVDMPRRIAARALAAAPGMGDLQITAGWFGVRPMTPDGMPIAGGAGPGADGLFLHGGHGSIGMMSAPATARWLAEEILRGRPPDELRQFRPDRF